MHRAQYILLKPLMIAAILFNSFLVNKKVNKIA